MIIGIKRLHIRCVIGVFPHEREAEQDLFVDLKVKTEFSGADELSATVDYVQMADLIVRIGVEGQFQLIETYAAKVVEQLLEQFPVSWVWVSIEKPVAIPSAACSMVEMEASR